MAFSSLPAQIGPFLVRNVLCTTHAGALLGVEDRERGRRQTVMLLDPDQPRWPARLRDRLPAHPHLCVLDQGAPQRIKCDDRTFYYVEAEPLCGWTALDEIEREGRLHPMGRALRLCAEAAEAIEHVHAAGRAHGHLEPGCLFIHSLADDHEGQVKVLGAGLDVQASPASRAGRYRPPEARSLRTVRARMAADLFAMGGVLYHMLTGHAPTAERSAAEALAQTGVQGPIAAIVLRAIDRDPRRRFPTMRVLREALRSLDASSPAPIAPGLLWYRGRAALA